MTKEAIALRRSGTIPPDVFADRTKWFKQAAKHDDDPSINPPPDPSLLISGLRKGDPARWEIGIVDAKVRRDPADGTPYIALTMAKPKKRRAEGEPDTSERWYDLEAAFLVQAHVFYGNVIRIASTRGGDKKIYHYTVCGIPGLSLARHLRLVIDAPAGKLAKAAKGEGQNFRDHRRRALGRMLTAEQAAAIYKKGQRRPRMERGHAITASLSAWSRRRKSVGFKLIRKDYAEMLSRGYELLDRHPLKFDKVQPAPKRRKVKKPKPAAKPKKA